MAKKASDWVKASPDGLWLPGPNIWIDPAQPVGRAIITHGHADHARAGHGQIWATPPTLQIMAERYGAGPEEHALPYGEIMEAGDIRISLHPAGHILGSAQVRLEHEGQVVVVSGDYKRRPDPTCEPFQPIPCDIFVTEATFALPVFRHPPAGEEVARALRLLAQNPERSLLVGAYALGKAQRIVMLMRAAGHHAPIYMHGAMQRLMQVYQANGVELGELRLASEVKADDMRGHVILAPPSALQDRWSRRLPEPITAMASGWMMVRARARQRGVEMPLVISDHADWHELIETLTELSPKEVWVTHGRDDALIRWCELNGLKAKALHLVGREDEAE